MNKVYIVYYDNGADYIEDHDVSISRVFANEQDANKYKDDENKRMADDDHPFGWKSSFFVVEMDVH